MSLRTEAERQAEWKERPWLASAKAAVMFTVLIIAMGAVGIGNDSVVVNVACGVAFWLLLGAYGAATRPRD